MTLKKKILAPYFLLRRIGLALEATLCLFFPWFWLLYWRWSGRPLQLKEAWARYLRGLRFVFNLLFNGTRQGVGVLNLNWLAPPIRASVASERPDYRPSGSCGKCNNCCTTAWEGGAAITCPFLGKTGCDIYGRGWWDFFNCGRYPMLPQHVSAYDCPRFESRLPILH